MKYDNLQRGNAAEDLALDFLTDQGLALVTRNFLCRAGEIDLIVKNATTLVFVEVRFRRDISRGTGAETITHQKMTKIVQTARYFLHNNPHHGNLDYRFDVISVSATVDWIQNAFTLDDLLNKDSR